MFIYYMIIYYIYMIIIYIYDLYIYIFNIYFIYIYTGDLLYVRYNCAKSYHYKICLTDFKEGDLFVPLSVSSPEKAHLK